VRRVLSFGVAVSVIATAALAGAQEGDDVEIPAARAKPASASAPAPAPAPDELATLRARLAELEARLSKVETRPAPAPSPPPPPPPKPVAATAPTYSPILGLPVYTTTARPDSGLVLDPVGVVLSSFAQVQYVGSQLSEDQVQQGGAPLNRDGFSLRLARVRLDGSWSWARFAVELSGNTVAGAYLGVLRAEASFLWRSKRAGRPPYVMVTGGLQEMPFGYELWESVRRRPFMERTLGSLALFPGSTDLGLRVSGGVSFLRYALAAMNGVPLVERAGAPYAVFTKARDFMGRLGFDTDTQARGFNVAGGVSFVAGTGFHRGTDATQGGLSWRDINENGILDNGEIVAVPGRAATPSLTYSRWAFNADLQLRVRSKIGWTQLYGEVTIASNLDRGFLVSDPVVAGYDVRQLAAYLAVTQQLTKWALIGFRWDYYDPNADLTDTRRGRVVPVNGGIHTLSPVVGANLFDHLRLLVQVDAILDRLGRDARGVPTDLANTQWTVRLQGDL